MIKNTHKEITVKNETYTYDERFPLVSIHLASNRPDQFTEFVKNIDATISNKNAYEIIVKIDSEDTRMMACVSELVKIFGEARIKPLIGPKKLGPWSTWEFYNDMFHLTHENAYFLWNPSDEVRFVTKDWDKVLLKYIGFFKDNIFRLKLSDNRLRNFYKFHEVLGCPDNFPFLTKKWMDLCGLWGDCHSPDVFHQAVSFYLGKKNIFRDIPIFDIELGGIEAGLLIPQKELGSRVDNIRKLWLIALSKKMRSRYMVHAAKIHFFIESCRHHAETIICKENISYPYQVSCSNNLGMSENKSCVDSTILFYSWKLRALRLRYRIGKIVRPLLRVINIKV